MVGTAGTSVTVAEGTLFGVATGDFVTVVAGAAGPVVSGPYRLRSAGINLSFVWAAFAALSIISVLPLNKKAVYPLGRRDTVASSSPASEDEFLPALSCCRSKIAHKVWQAMR